MAKKKITVLLAIIILAIIYLPNFLRLNQLSEENRKLEEDISDLKKKNEELKKEIEKLETDPTYLEGVAREKLKMLRKGEIIYKTE